MNEEQDKKLNCIISTTKKFAQLSKEDKAMILGWMLGTEQERARQNSKTA